MPIINSYPKITPKGEDLVLISDISEEGNPTKTGKIDELWILALISLGWCCKTLF